MNTDKITLGKLLFLNVFGLFDWTNFYVGHIFDYLSGVSVSAPNK